MDIRTKLEQLVNLIKLENNQELHNLVLDLQKDVKQLVEANHKLQKKVDAKEGCYWDSNSDGG